MCIRDSSRPPGSVALQAQPTLNAVGEAATFKRKWMVWLEALMSSAKRSMSKEQRRYKANFDDRLRRSRARIEPGQFVFLRKEFISPQDRKHKLSPIADGPFRVAESDDHTVVVERGDGRERVSLDRVEAAPPPVCLLYTSPSPRDS